MATESLTVEIALFSNCSGVHNCSVDEALESDYRVEIH